MKRVARKKCWGRCLALFLIMTIIIGIVVNKNLLKVNANEENVDIKVNENEIVSSEDEILEDGTIKTTTIKNDGSKIVTFVKEENLLVINYDKNEEKISEECINVLELINMYSNYGEEDYEPDEEEEDYSHEKADKTKWQKKYTADWSLSYPIWYRTGSKGKTEYLKIGCKAKYLINYTKLNSDKQGKCDAFRKAVRDCGIKTKTFLNGVAVLGVSAVSLVVATIISGGSATVIVDKIQKLLGISVGGSILTAIACGISANTLYEDAKDYYLIIRHYGKKY